MHISKRHPPRPPLVYRCCPCLWRCSNFETQPVASKSGISGCRSTMAPPKSSEFFGSSFVRRMSIVIGENYELFRIIAIDFQLRFKMWLLLFESTWFGKTSNFALTSLLILLFMNRRIILYYVGVWIMKESRKKSVCNNFKEIIALV